jgi:hypothetical protein
MQESNTSNAKIELEALYRGVEDEPNHNMNTNQYNELNQTKGQETMIYPRGSLTCP